MPWALFMPKVLFMFKPVDGRGGLVGTKGGRKTGRNLSPILLRLVAPSPSFPGPLLPPPFPSPSPSPSLPTRMPSAECAPPPALLPAPPAPLPPAPLPLPSCSRSCPSWHPPGPARTEPVPPARSLAAPPGAGGPELLARKASSWDLRRSRRTD